MNQLTFPPAEVQALARQRYSHPDPCARRRLDILWFKYLGYPHQQIAALADCSRSTVQRALADYASGGRARLCQAQRPARQPGTLEEHRAALQALFAEVPPRSVKHARHLIEQHTGVRRGLTQVRHFLHRLGLAPRKVAAIPVPPKLTLPEHARAQAEFKRDKLGPQLEEARRGLRQLFFVDAAHFVHGSLLGLLWCLARLCIRAASGRRRYNVLAALDAVSHRLVQVCNHGYINAASVCQLLRAVAAGAVPGVPLTLVLDNARYQKCAAVQDLARQLGIELMYLPSYSPNLNLIERVWKFIKGQCLRARHYATYTEFHTAIQQCLDELHTTHKEAMNTLLTHEFQTFEDVSLVAA